MKQYFILIILTLIFSLGSPSYGQDKVQQTIEHLEKEKQRISDEARELLKKEVITINKKLSAKEITETEAQRLKSEAAKRHALNIENKHAIIDNQILLIQRNPDSDLQDFSSFPLNSSSNTFTIRALGKSNNNLRHPKKSDVRTYDELIFAFGLNNAIIDGQSLDDSPYKIGGSRFFEIGWAWRTRVFKNSNALRFHYGFSFQFNGLKADNNNYFVNNEGQTELEEFDYNLKKAKLRMDNLVIPIHFEFGPSKKIEREDRVRYSLRNQFRIGLGGYAGINLGTRQKLKYSIDGEKVKDKLKRDYNTGNFIYGLSAYIGIGSTALYAKYDLNPLFEDANIEQHNLSLGLRFDL